MIPDSFHQEIQFISKRERMDHQPHPDLLSDLPLSIIHIILACLPIRDAVRTSVLSRQWRYTWTSLPHLVFGGFCANLNGEPVHKFVERVKNTVTHVLYRHQGPIHKFKMPIFSKSLFPEVDEWILHLSRNDIKELNLRSWGPDSHCSQQGHSSIYSCEKLTNLELHNFELDPPPSSFKGFLFLRRLSLHSVYLSTSGIESLVSSSPLLEEFTLVDIGYADVRMLRIHAPNLKCLNLSGHYLEICLYAPLLTEMWVLLSEDDFSSKHQQQKSSACNYTDFIGGLTYLEKLCGEIHFIRYLSIGMEFCHHTLTFHHLQNIEMHHLNFEDIKQISVVARLVIGAPNLHTLMISTDLDGKADDDVALDSESPEVRFSDFGCAPDFVFEKLRVVVMGDISGFPSEVEFMVFLLQSSPVLEMMMLDYLNTVSTEKRQLLKHELLGCGWASSNAELLSPTIP